MANVASQLVEAISVVFFSTAACAMDVQRAEAQFKDREYRVELDLVLHASIAHVEAVLRDYSNYPLLNDDVLEAKVLDRPDAATAMLFTKLRACAGLFCRTVRRVERVQETAFELLAVVVPEQSDVVSGRTHTVLEAVDGSTLIRYRTSVEPKFWVPPLIGRPLMVRKLRESSLDLFRRVEMRAQRD